MDFWVLVSAKELLCLVGKMVSVTCLEERGTLLDCTAMTWATQFAFCFSFSLDVRIGDWNGIEGLHERS